MKREINWKKKLSRAQGTCEIITKDPICFFLIIRALEREEKRIGLKEYSRNNGLKLIKRL